MLSLSMARHRLDCTSAADMSTRVMEMLSIKFHYLSMAHYGIGSTNASDMSTRVSGPTTSLLVRLHSLNGTPSNLLLIRAHVPSRLSGILLHPLNGVPPT